MSREMQSLGRVYMDLSHRSGRMVVSDNEVTAGQFEQYGALLSESLLSLLQPLVESIVGDALVPSYSFWRIYGHGAVLRQHVDRAACEIGVSVTVASEPEDVDWPLWVRGIDGRVRAIGLRSGDGLIYWGTQVPHWRDSFDGGLQYQMFLHYVRRDGAHACWAHDGREACGLPPIRPSSSAGTS
ncbi:hypothetical protein FRZ61_47520 [Hypericibacter adhaerens]|uniref:Ferrochelatase n=1 Tax=Hypericibacter adhaerens TaxID=2602016 RepID=A0A5J6N7K8_9PROT|nr:hypothetical protein FRZ61_47520 [Hypericibacter adhaerens]